MGISTRPVRLILPDRAKTLVPLLVAVPMELYQEAPFSKIVGTFERVSTLLITVGFSNNPLVEGKGGRGRGIPLFPSMLWIRAVSSPQTNAPAPILINKSNEKFVPATLEPNNPKS